MATVTEGDTAGPDAGRRVVASIACGLRVALVPPPPNRSTSCNRVGPGRRWREVDLEAVRRPPTGSGPAIGAIPRDRGPLPRPAATERLLQDAGLDGRVPSGLVRPSETTLEGWQHRRTRGSVSPDLEAGAGGGRQAAQVLGAESGAASIFGVPGEGDADRERRGGVVCAPGDQPAPEGVLHLRAHAKSGRWNELEASELTITGWRPTSRIRRGG